MALPPFRFIAPMPILRSSTERWLEQIRRIEDLGFSSIAVSDHLTGGWSMDPIVALTGAATATTRLRLLSLVLGNDFRHPVVLHRAIAMLDVLSGGRIELGLGAGWMESDYEATGIPFDRAGTRIDRLAESLAAFKLLCGDDLATLDGEHYRLRCIDGLPKPVQRPHPKLLVGGGGERMLRLAAREADIVGVHCRLAGGTLDEAAVRDFLPEHVDTKVRWVRDAAVEAGRDPASLELQFTVYSFRIEKQRSSSGTRSSRFAELLARIGAEHSPAVVHGSLGACEEKLYEVRERYGFNYFKLGGDVDVAAPLVARLAGR